MASSTAMVPKMGPEPVLLSRKEIDMLYVTLQAVTAALDHLGVDYIVTGGSLLGAVRQHSILFCDDDIDIAIIERDGECYSRVISNLQRVLGEEFIYSVRPWEGGDRIRPKKMSSIFLDLFTIRKFECMGDLIDLIGVKKNGSVQSTEYVKSIVDKINESAHSQGEQSPLCPFWHFNTRKAVEMWPKEVYRSHEMFPLCRELKFGPLSGVSGPKSPVRLLKRAFGLNCFEVFFQSGSHAKSKGSDRVISHEAGERDGEIVCAPSTGTLPPHVQAGGNWEGGREVALSEEQYLPMQPVLKAKRRATLHCKHALMGYLVEQERLEEEWEIVHLNKTGHGRDRNRDSRAQPESLAARPRRTVYMDGVFDLFHVGHLEAIKQCALLGDRVVIGVTGDEDAADYKRPPIISQSNRVSVVEAIKDVDAVVCPCPLVVKEDFMKEWDIDLVVHGFASDADAQKQEEFFSLPMSTGRFRRIGYYGGLSTTDIINKISKISEDDESRSSGCIISAEEDNSGADLKKSNQVSAGENRLSAARALALCKPQWFGTAVAAATNCSPEVPTDPFPLALRSVIEPFVRKASTRREEVLRAVRESTGAAVYDEAVTLFMRPRAHSTALSSPSLADEGDFFFDSTHHPLLGAFLASSHLPPDTDLSLLHQDPEAKDNLFLALTQSPTAFQEEFDRFVREVCVPRVAALCGCEEVYYQAFPCIRVVQPEDFSIGPHADAAYGHHPCSVNFYVPLTDIRGTSSLFLESRPGSEDWHPVQGGYGWLKHFAGAMCSHWTTENSTGATRVSLDFRLITGPLFEALQCGGQKKGGQRDVYREREGYYTCCRLVETKSSCTTSNRGSGNSGSDSDRGIWRWERQGPLLSPDARIGFPWSVRDLEKHLLRKKVKAQAVKQPE